MTSRRLAVIGASGDVGSGIVRSAVRRGWDVTAVGRTAARLDELLAEHGPAVRPLVGSVADDEGGAALAAELGAVDAVVVTVSAPFELRPILEWSPGDLGDLLEANVGAHLVAARHLLPVVRAGGDFLGIGGGMADLVIPTFVPLSIVQSAQRQLYRGLVREAGRQPVVRIRELLVSAMVNGPSSRERAQPDWITEDEIGEHVADLLDVPRPQETASAAGRPEPVLTLTSPRAAQRA